MFKWKIQQCPNRSVYRTDDKQTTKMQRWNHRFQRISFYRPEMGSYESHCIKMLTNLETYLGINTSSNTLPLDFGKSRADFSNTCVAKAYSVIANWGSPFEHCESLVNVASGREAPEEVKNDLINARSIGEKAFEKFLEESTQM